jgi:3-methyladenine DNA glycosylase AlkC
MENESAFKNLISPAVVEDLAREIAHVDPTFNRKGFLTVSKELPPLELKARVLAITSALRENLPSDYRKSVKILVDVLERGKLSGFSLWPFSEYIGQFGLEHFDESMDAMYVLTEKFTSEFAVRPFFLKDTAKTLRYFTKWATDPNHHVRRWVSEGSRPLLPWGARLPEFVKDPRPTLKLLERLKYDEELYVRKSVANHLNDISKSHPKLVLETLRTWQKSAPTKHEAKIAWIKRHALRTLIKKGDPGALRLMGVTGEARIRMSPLSLAKEKLKLGEKLEFHFEVRSTAAKRQKLVIDYVIHFVKANGELSPKVYKLKSIDLDPGEKIGIAKNHSLRPITTKVYHSGLHRVSIQVNGKVFSEKKWHFAVPTKPTDSR